MRRNTRESFYSELLNNDKNILTYGILCDILSVKEWRRKKEGGKNMIKKKLRFPLVMTVCAWAAFLFVFLLLDFGSVKPVWGISLLFAVPGLILTAVTVLAAKERLGEKYAELLTGVISLISIPVCVVMLFFTIMKIAVSDVTDPSCYRRMLRAGGYPRSAVLSQFPEDIPKDASDVSMLYRPQVLQGSGEYLLACVLPKETCRETGERRKKDAIDVYSLEDAEKHGISLHILPEQYRNLLTEDTEILLFERRPDQDYANHGTIRIMLWDPCGIAVWYSTVW